MKQNFAFKFQFRFSIQISYKKNQKQNILKKQSNQEFALKFC